jgi:hypothetical protein
MTVAKRSIKPMPRISVRVASKASDDAGDGTATAMDGAVTLLWRHNTF